MLFNVGPVYVNTSLIFTGAIQTYPTTTMEALYDLTSLHIRVKTGAIIDDTRLEQNILFKLED